MTTPGQDDSRIYFAGNHETLEAGHISIVLLHTKRLGEREPYEYLAMLSLRSPAYEIPHGPALFVRNEESGLFVPDTPEAKRVEEEQLPTWNFVETFRGFDMLRRLHLGEADIKMATLSPDFDETDRVERLLMNYIIEKGIDKRPPFTRPKSDTVQQNTPDEQAITPEPPPKTPKLTREQRPPRAKRVATIEPTTLTGPALSDEEKELIRRQTERRFRHTPTPEQEAQRQQMIRENKERNRRPREKN